MPNHVSTNLSVCGLASDVRAFVTAVDNSKKESQKGFDFNGVVPMPTILLKVSSPPTIQTQAEIDACQAEFEADKAAGKLSEYQLKMGKPFNLGITQETSDKLKKEHGFNNWYEWSCANWGTKWGAYDETEWQFENNDAVANISYNTAWGPASEFFIAASKKFPMLTFKLQYADEGGGFVCEAVCEDGNFEETSFDWESEEGIRVRDSVGYGPL